MLDHFVHSFEISVLLVLVFFYLLGYRPPWWSKTKLDPKCQSKLATDNPKYQTILAPKCQTKDIPGPWALPLLGTRWIYSKLGGYTLTRIHEFYQDMFKRHGPVFKEEALWNVPVISIVERRDIERVLRVSGKYPIRPPTEAIAHYRRSRPDRYASTGLVNEQGEMWYNLRTNLTGDLTSPKTISSFLPQVEEISDDWCNLLRQVKDSKSHISNVEDLASRLGLEAICTLVLGRRMGFLLVDQEDDITARLARAVNAHFVACRDTYYGLPFWKIYPTSAYRSLVDGEEEIYNLVLELINGADDATKESAVFQSVLRADVDSREKTAAIVDFIAAGIYTLRNSLLFLLYLVAEDRRVQDCILQDETGSYAKACMNETFRLLPTANCLARIVESDVELSGYHLPPGSVILCHTGLACRDDRNFTSANTFNPERWLGQHKSTTTSSATYLVLPFGIGRRTCPGKRFIEQVLPVILKQTVQNFRLGNTAQLELQFEFLLAPKAPMGMVFEER